MCVELIFGEFEGGEYLWFGFVLVVERVDLDFDVVVIGICVIYWDGYVVV